MQTHMRRAQARMLTQNHGGLRDGCGDSIWQVDEVTHSQSLQFTHASCADNGRIYFDAVRWRTVEHGDPKRARHGHTAERLLVSVVAVYYCCVCCVAGHFALLLGDCCLSPAPVAAPAAAALSRAQGRSNNIVCVCAACVFGWMRVIGHHSVHFISHQSFAFY